MIVDKPKEKPKHRNMQLTEAEVDQISVYNELIQESIIPNHPTKKTTRKKRNEEGQVQKDEQGNDIWEEFIVEKLKLKKNIEDYNKFRKAKKNYIKTLRSK